MNTLKDNWWKICTAVILGLILDMALHIILPIGGIDLKPSDFSQTIGLIPGIVLLLAIIFTVIAATFVFLYDGLIGQKWGKGIRCGLAMGSLWFVGMFEASVVGVEPWSNTISMAIADAIPVLLMSVVLALLMATEIKSTTQKVGGSAIYIIGLAFMAGRFLEYLILQPQLEYWSNPLVTFSWTLALGLSVGAMYWLLASGLKGKSPMSRTIWFAGVVFGLNWWLFNIFVPVLFQAPAAFTMTIVTIRVIVDTIFVALGVFTFERMFGLKSQAQTIPSHTRIS